MDCKTAQSFVIPYIKNELTDQQEEAFLRHVFVCRECFEELEIFYTVYVALQRLDEERHMSYDMQAMLWNNLKAAERRIIWRKLIHYFSYGVMIAAEVVLALMLITGTVGGRVRLGEDETQRRAALEQASEKDSQGGQEAASEKGAETGLEGSESESGADKTGSEGEKTEGA